MPNSGLDYDKHGRIARVKPKTKDQDTRSIASASVIGRRHRDSSTSSSRAALPAECLTPQPESSSSSVVLDQLPSLPESEAGSPTSTTSPMSRSISSVSASTAVASSSFHRVPASLQAYLEPDNSGTNSADESHATPRAEKTKEQSEIKADPPRIELTDHFHKQDAEKLSPVETSSLPESGKAIRARSSSRLAQAPPAHIDTHRDVQQPLPKRPPSANSTTGYSSSASTTFYSHGSAPPDQQLYQTPQMTYLALPQIPDPVVEHQALVPHGMHYYPEYNLQMPPEHMQQQLQYAPAPESDRSEDRGTLLQRVQSAIPDFQSLIVSYQDVCGMLESREGQIRSIESQRGAEMQQQAIRFAQLEREIESIMNKHASESSQSRQNISDLEKRCKQLQDKLTTEGKAREAMQAANDAVRAELRRAERQHEERKAALTQKMSADKDSLTAEYRGKQKTLHDQLQAQLQAQAQKAEANLSLRLAECNRLNEREKQELENAWTKRRREMEDRHDKEMCSLEDGIEAKQKIVEEERRTYLQAREGWDKERDMMLRRFEEERSILRKTSEEQQKALVTRHEREINNILKQVSHAQDKSDKEETILKQQREMEALRAGWEADKFRFQQKATDFRNTAKTLNEQNGKLQRLMESFGDIGESRSK